MTTQETLCLHNSIDNEMVEIDTIDSAVKYVKDNYIDGQDIHPDFYSFNIYKRVAIVSADINENDVCTGIKVINEPCQQEMTQTMTKEIDGILEKYHHGEYDLIEVRKLFIIAHQQQLSAERERAGKLVEALDIVIKRYKFIGFISTATKLQQTLNEYDASTKES